MEGRPVLTDPTKNVLDLVDAAVTRLNDLFNMEKEHRQEIGKIRSVHEVQIRELQKDLRNAETARIDAIRAVDVGAVQRAAEVQADVATALANQVALSAETLRNTVSETATAGATALAQALDPLQKAIDDLRRAQYEQQGQKTQVIESRASAEDFSPVIEAITRLERAQNNREGEKAQVIEQRASNSNVLAWIGGGIAILLVIIAVINFTNAQRNRETPTRTVTVITTPTQTTP
jgi:hypothetical protein